MMASAIAYGSISIVDLTDVGEFSVMPMSNLPLTVVYDPDQDAFTPNWGDSNVTVTPLVYYAGKTVELGTDGLSISWQRQVGVSGYTDLVSGESVVDDGVLSITQNQFTSNSSMITYIVTATYVEPTAQITLTAQGQITFSLVKNSSGAKTCFINGGTIFKYNGSGTLVGDSTITLTGTVNNVTISAWQYQDGNGEWQSLGSTDTTITIAATDNIFFNDKCIIKLATSESSVYDLHTITKLRDGVAGDAVVSAVLTNDNQMIPYTSDGVGDFSSATSQIIIYEGGEDVTSSWTISQEYTNVTATPSTTTVANDTVTVSDMSTSTGNVTFSCTKTDYDPITKTFSLVKVESGADGTSPTIYTLDVDALALNKDISNPPVFTPSSVTFKSYSQTGSGAKEPYSCRFRIYENADLSNYESATANFSSTDDNNSSVEYTPSGSGTETILCIQYKAGGFTEILDSQTVVITGDGATGAKGDDGDKGDSAVNVILGNYADVLSCTNGNTIIGSGSPQQQTILIPFVAYEGTERIACTVASQKLLDVTPTITDATTTSEGYIQWDLPAGTSVSSANGTVSLTFTATTGDGTPAPVVETYSWSRNSAPADAVFLQIYASSGSDTITDTITSVTLQGQLTEGAANITDTATISWQWYKWDTSSGTYAELSGETSSSLTVNDNDVQSYASYMLQASYGTNKYYAYFSVYDKHDPIQVAVLSSIGTQIVNGVGAGAIYAKVTRNGSEIDAMYSETFATSDPTGASSGDYYYKINKTNKTVTLMKYSGSSWSTSSDTYSGTYTWSWRDKDGNSITSINGYTLPTDGKVIYIDSDYIDTKIIVDVEVEI